jgi:hypothetical protein
MEILDSPLEEVKENEEPRSNEEMSYEEGTLTKIE